MRATDRALMALIDEMRLRFVSILHDFERKAAQLGDEQWRRGYQHGYLEGSRDNDERSREASRREAS